MSQVLYRKLRPQNFAEVVGQEAIKTTLKNAVATDSVAHAYLFIGPRGVGKTSVARILAKAVNCIKKSQTPNPKSQKHGEPCGECENCLAVMAGNFLDLIEIDAASNTGVDNIREIIEHVKFTPSKGRFKVIVIDEVHMLSKGAFNALLKTLEEPPAHALFILATTEVNKVPATIISRTQRFDFKKITEADIAEQLTKAAETEKFSIPDEVAYLVARAAEGSLRDGLSLLGQLLSFSSSTRGKSKITLEQAEEILGLTSFAEQQEFFIHMQKRDIPSAIKHLQKLAEAGRDILQFSHGFLEYLDTLLGQSVESSMSGAGELDKSKIYAKIPQDDLVRLINIFLTSAQKVKYSPIPELPLKLAVIEFCGASTTPPPITPAATAHSNPAPEKILPASRPDAEDVTNESGENLINEISLKWNEFLGKVREYNHSLISSLRLATLVYSDDAKLVLAFPYRFHKEAVEQRKNKVVLEKVLEEVYSKPLRLICCLTHEMDEYRKSPNPNPENSLVTEALKVFRVEGSASN